MVAVAECAYEMVLQCLLFTVSRRSADEVQQACHCLLVEGCKDVEIPGVVCHTSTKAELHFGLCKLTSGWEVYTRSC